MLNRTAKNILLIIAIIAIGVTPTVLTYSYYSILYNEWDSSKWDHRQKKEVENIKESNDDNIRRNNSE